MNEVIFGDNKFCGPAVLSILTGKDTNYTTDVLRRITHKYEIKGVQPHELESAIDLLGFKAHIQTNLSNYSLFSLCQSIYNKDGMYMVILPKHVVAIEVKDSQVYFCDNHTKSPIKTESSARLSQKVNAVYKIEEKPKLLELSSKVQVTINRMVDSRVQVFINKDTIWSDGHKDFKCMASVVLTENELKEFKTQIIML